MNKDDTMVVYLLLLGITTLLLTASSLLCMALMLSGYPEFIFWMIPSGIGSLLGWYFVSEIARDL